MHQPFELIAHMASYGARDQFPNACIQATFEPKALAELSNALKKLWGAQQRHKRTEHAFSWPLDQGFGCGPLLIIHGLSGKHGESLPSVVTVALLNTG
jgi:hypothetical protein